MLERHVTRNMAGGAAACCVKHALLSFRKKKKKHALLSLTTRSVDWSSFLRWFTWNLRYPFSQANISMHVFGL